MKITTLKQLYNAALNRKAITGPGRFFKLGPKSASWIFNMKPFNIMNLMREGMEIYKPKRKPNTHK